MNSSKRRELFGEEPRCWFSPAVMATVLGCTKYDIEDAVDWLQAQGRIGARYDAAGDCFARVVGPVPLSTPGRRELAAEARLTAANQPQAAQVETSSPAGLDLGTQTGSQAERPSRECGAARPGLEQPPTGGSRP